MYLTGAVVARQMIWKRHNRFRCDGTWIGFMRWCWSVAMLVPGQTFVRYVCQALRDHVAELEYAYILRSEIEAARRGELDTPEPSNLDIAIGGWR